VRNGERTQSVGGRRAKAARAEPVKIGADPLQAAVDLADALPRNGY
jgi:hypothetical protein